MLDGEASGLMNIGRYSRAKERAEGDSPTPDGSGHGSGLPAAQRPAGTEIVGIAGGGNRGGVLEASVAGPELPEG